MAGGLRELRVWQEAVTLAAEVVRAGRRAHRREVRLAIDTLTETALALAGDVAEGAARHDTAEQLRLYLGARGRLARLETLLAIARQAELIDATSHARLSERATAVSRLVSGYVVYLERQREAGVPGVGSI